MACEVFYTGVLYLLRTLKRRLYLSWLDPLAVYLDHPVFTVQIEYVAGRKPLYEISCVQERLMAVLLLKWILYKGFFCQRCQIAISCGQIARDAELALVRFIPVLVQDIEAFVACRASNGSIVISPVYREHQHGGGCLGHSIGVHKLEAVWKKEAHPFASGDRPP